MDTQGVIWITDFGLAKLAGHEFETGEDALTHTGDIVGTLRYMAPERFEGHSDLRCDIYSLGLTLYELLVRKPAFTETDRNRLIQQVTHQSPTPPRKLNPAIPRDLETIVLKSIARDPVHRYATAGELATDLKCFLEDRPIRARRVRRISGTPMACRARFQAERHPPTEQRGGRSAAASGRRAWQAPTRPARWRVESRQQRRLGRRWRVVRCVLHRRQQRHRRRHRRICGPVGVLAGARVTGFPPVRRARA